MTHDIAEKILATGLNSLDLSFSGLQEVIDSLSLGYKLEQQMEAFNVIKYSCYQNQKIKLYTPLTAPDETLETLQKTIDRINDRHSTKHPGGKTLGRLIGLAYLKAAESVDVTCDYIGRARMENIEIALKKLQEDVTTNLELLPEYD